MAPLPIMLPAATAASPPSPATRSAYSAAARCAAVDDSQVSMEVERAPSVQRQISCSCGTYASTRARLVTA
jgi:hypothetical protein